MLAPNLPEIVHIVIMNRERPGRIYLPGALDRIVSAAKKHEPFCNSTHLADVLEDCIGPEEKDIDRDKIFFDQIALPGWQEWSRQMREVA